MWQMAAEGQSDRMAFDMEVHVKQRSVTVNSSIWKQWHTLTLISAYWMFLETKHWMWAQWGGEWCISAVVTVGHLCWCRLLCAWHAASCSSVVKMHSEWWRLSWKRVFCTWEFALLNSAAVLFASVVVSIDIIWRHYFQSNLHSCGPRQFLFTQCGPGMPKSWTPIL